MQPASTRSQPLYASKAGLFKALSHPARIRVLEILSASKVLVIARTFLADTLETQRDQFASIASLPPLPRVGVPRR